MQRQPRPAQLDRAQGQPALQRSQLVQFEFERVEGQPLGPLGIDRLQPAQRQVAADAQRGGAGLRERGAQVGVQRGRLQPQRQRRRQVGQVGLQVERLQLQAGFGLARGIERQCLRARVEGAAIDHEGQLRLHLDLARRRQAAQKRQRQPQLAHLVLPAGRAVVEVDAPVGQLDVVERKARQRRGFGRRRPRRQPRQQVVDVVAPLAQVRQVQRGRLDAQGIDDGRQAKHRLQLGVGPQARHAQQRRRARRGVDAQVMERQLQRPGPHHHRADVHRPPQLGTGDLLALPLEQRRQRQPGQRPQRQQADQGDGQAAAPAPGGPPGPLRRGGRRGDRRAGGLGGWGRQQRTRHRARIVALDLAPSTCDMATACNRRAPMRKPGVSACGRPAGLSGSVTKASWSARVRIGKLAVSGCGGKQEIASFQRLTAGPFAVSATADGCLPTHARVTRATSLYPAGAARPSANIQSAGPPALPAPIGARSPPDAAIACSHGRSSHQAHPFLISKLESKLQISGLTRYFEHS